MNLQNLYGMKIYDGTGTADVWEVFGNHGAVTSIACSQGWRPLEPLTAASFKDPSFKEYVNITLGERSPRAVIMEAPSKVWRSSIHLNREDSKSRSHFFTNFKDSWKT